MQNPERLQNDLDLVRQILRSKIFLSSDINQQQLILNKILETGQITREDLVTLINQESIKQESTEQESDKLRTFLNSLDYNTFITFVTTGNIRGQHLITLCDTSKKLNEYCNRSFQLRDVKGDLVGKTQSQYLFRLLLDKMNIPIGIGKTPRQTYIERTIGGQVLGFGDDSYGQLGLRYTVRYNSDPFPIENMTDIIQISAGGSHSLCLDNKGKVWAFGSNLYGQLGRYSDQNKTYIPTLIPDMINIIQIDAGGFSSLCLDNQGRVWSFGHNAFGQLGLGDNIDRNTPTLVPNLNNIIQVCAGGNHSLCLDKHGKVWTFGSNDGGQLGLDDRLDRNIPNLIEGLNNIVQISNKGAHSLCLDRKGKVWSFGWGDRGQLGLGNHLDETSPALIRTLKNIIQVSVGSNHSLCLDKNGRVWGFGSNQYGESGFGDKTDKTKPDLIPTLYNIIQVSAGNENSICLDNQGRVWVFGNNSYGKLGISIQAPTNVPILNGVLNNISQVSAGAHFTLVIRKL